MSRAILDPESFASLLLKWRRTTDIVAVSYFRAGGAGSRPRGLASRGRQPNAGRPDGRDASGRLRRRRHQGRTGKFNRTHGYVVGYDPERIRRLVDAGAVGSVEGLE